MRARFALLLKWHILTDICAILPFYIQIVSMLQLAFPLQVTCARLCLPILLRFGLMPSD